MDQEIDLRPHLIALLHRWRLLVICTIGLAVITGATSLTLALIFRTASADVLIIPSSSRVTLDPRFQTTSDNQATNPVSLRQGLVNLASSYILVEQVAKDLGDPEVTIDKLYQQVKILPDGDMIRISVSNANSDLALQIVKVWGKTYEDLVTSVYGGSQFRSEVLTAEIDTAQQRYEQAQTALEKFLTSAQSMKVKQQIANLNDLLSGSRQAQQQLYTDYLSRVHQIEILLQDAQTLHDQADTQGTSKFANSFASLMLRIRMVDGAAPVFRMTAADVTASETDSGNLSANLSQLIKMLSHRQDQLRTRSNEIASAITSSGMISTGLDGATRERYMDQVAELNSTYENLQAQQNTITQQRDLAYEALTLLQRKRAEQEVAQSSPQIVIRFIGAGIDPLFSLITRTLLYMVAAAILGLVFSIMIALLIDTIIPAIRRLMSSEVTLPAKRSDTPADSATQSS